MSEEADDTATAAQKCFGLQVQAFMTM